MKTLIVTLVLALALGCYSRSDPEITAEVESDLDEAGIGGNVAVTSTNGVVTLTGTTPSDPLRDKAEDIAEDVAGVKRVVNNIRTTAAGDAPQAPPPLTR